VLQFLYIIKCKNFFGIGLDLGAVSITPSRVFPTLTIKKGFHITPAYVTQILKLTVNVINHE